MISIFQPNHLLKFFLVYNSTRMLMKFQDAFWKGWIFKPQWWLLMVILKIIGYFSWEPYWCISLRHTVRPWFTNIWVGNFHKYKQIMHGEHSYLWTNRGSKNHCQHITGVLPCGHCAVEYSTAAQRSVTAKDVWKQKEKQ